MGNKTMLLVAKAAESAAGRVRAVAAGEHKTSQAMTSGQPMTTQAAGVNSSAASAIQPSAVAAVGSSGDAPRYIKYYDLKLVYSGDSDDDSNSKKAERAESEPEVA